MNTPVLIVLLTLLQVILMMTEKVPCDLARLG
ncbi:MAG: hypothetical protein JWR67_2531, partial [Mucilaginibacter sp.]|nr:hypothetical protein [Mucilaginibacter sp.]